MAINLPCLQPSHRGYWSKLPALSLWRKCSLWRASSTFHGSALSSAAEELMPVSVVETQDEKRSWPQRWKQGDREAILSASCSGPQGYGDEVVCPLSVSSHPQSLFYNHRHTESHSAGELALNFISCCLISASCLRLWFMLHFAFKDH